MSKYFPPLTSTTVDTTGSQVLASDGGRQGLLVVNPATNTANILVYLQERDGQGAPAGAGVPVEPGGSWPPANAPVPSNAIWIKSASGSQAVLTSSSRG